MNEKKNKFVIPGAAGNRESINNKGEKAFITAGFRVHARNDRRGGFTLIELLVVVLIIGVLAAIALPQYQKAVMKARFTQLKVLAKSLADAEEVYHLANGQYATKLEDLDVQLPGGQLNTSTESMYYYPWGFCYLDIKDSDTKHNQVACKSTDIGMEYQQRLNFGNNPNTYGCIAYNTNLSSPQNQLCKAETGASTYASQNTSVGYTSWRY